LTVTQENIVEGIIPTIIERALVVAQELTIRVCLVDLEDTKVSDIGTKD
jgi:hypothetical protein